MFRYRVDPGGGVRSSASYFVYVLTDAEEELPAFSVIDDVTKDRIWDPYDNCWWFPRLIDGSMVWATQVFHEPGIFLRHSETATAGSRYGQVFVAKSAKAEAVQIVKRTISGMVETTHTESDRWRLVTQYEGDSKGNLDTDSVEMVADQYGNTEDETEILFDLNVEKYMNISMVTVGSPGTIKGIVSYDFRLYASV